MNSLALDIRTFGAAGDGSTDDAPAINKAIVAASAAGCTLTAEGGTFLIKSALLFASAVSLKFTQGATIKAWASLPTRLDENGNPQYIMGYVTSNDVIFEGATFDGNSNATGVIGIWVATGYTGVKVKNNCIFKNIAYNGVNISVGVLFRPSAHYGLVDHCTFTNSCAAATSQGGRGVEFTDNIYVAPTAGVNGDTVFGFDGGQGIKAAGNLLYYGPTTDAGTYYNPAGIEVSNGASDFLVTGNTILGQRGGAGIYVFQNNGTSPGYGTVSNNILDGLSYTANGNFAMIKVFQGSNNVVVEGNQLLREATGTSNSTGIFCTAATNIVRNNTIRCSSLHEAIGWDPGAGTLDIYGNVIDTASRCCNMLDTTTNSGKVVWIKDNTFLNATIGINVNGATEANSPVYHADNKYIGITTNPVLGTRWDPAFTPNAGFSGTWPHYCGYRTVVQCTGSPDGTFARGGGSFQQGDIFWQTLPLAGGSPGWICTTAGVAGSGAVFKAMAALAA